MEMGMEMVEEMVVQETGGQAGEWRVPPSAVVRDSCAAVLRIQFELSMPGLRLPEAAGNKALNLCLCHICCALSSANFKGAYRLLLYGYWLLVTPCRDFQDSTPPSSLGSCS